jgi:3-oxoacyl-[acyl-carrier-protein] synthase III
VHRLPVGLATAAAFVETGQARAALVVGADGLSRYLERDDRGTAMPFGDGSGAAVVTAAAPGAAVGPVVLHSDPDGSDLIRLGRDDLRIRIDGPVVFRHAVRLMVDRAVRRGAGGWHHAGATVLLAAFGAGLVWGGTVVTLRG